MFSNVNKLIEEKKTKAERKAMNINITAPVHEVFKQACKANNISLSACIEKMMLDFAQSQMLARGSFIDRATETRLEVLQERLAAARKTIEELKMGPSIAQGMDA